MASGGMLFALADGSASIKKKYFFKKKRELLLSGTNDRIPVNLGNLL